MNRLFPACAAALLPLLLQATPTHAASFDCSKAAPGSIAALVCSDASLGKQDEQLAAVYKQAQAKAKNETPPTLKAEQRGWLKGRDECWKAEDKTKCVADSYQRRIVELQARYALVASEKPMHLICDNKADSKLVATLFLTQPPALLATYADSESLMFAQPAGDGRKYQGRNESLELREDGATVVWGYEAKPMNCKRQ